ncbi:hypothetical protein BS50DRAFT_258639 [Corynespora cassiicola Philippines]|uniref:Borealin N-terminal domain-containing protein n=1 Tax=Corynespora cassiicola Philippines TaxID=1448308 RepID=A0A2T2N1M4_CORCC|nr:hypothetical protein BS50DRAFT_258639 [Corynespora cassiicola Philippines]
MALVAMTAEQKAHMRANLELEITARRDKLQAMCEAQVASLASRLERRINRVPVAIRSTTIHELLDAASKPAITTEKKENVRVSHKTQAQPKPKPVAKKEAPKKEAAHAPLKTARGIKRKSDEQPSTDKENDTIARAKKVKSVNAPAAKPAAKTAAKPATKPAAKSAAKSSTAAAAKNKPTAPTRATRAASKTIAAEKNVLSPKPNNARPAARATARKAR